MTAYVALVVLAASAGAALSDDLADDRSRPDAVHASRVCVDNRAGFVMSFEMWDTASNMLSRRSADYAAPGQACMDMWTVPYIEAGRPIVTVIHSQEGMSQSLPPVHYLPEGGSANFTCSGTTFLYSCSLGDRKLQLQPGAMVALPSSPEAEPVRAKGICVQNNGGFRLTFRLWDTAINAVGSWSEGFNKDSNSCLDADNSTAIDSPIALVTSPQGGFQVSFQSVLYSPEAASATFVCSGTTVNYDCVLLSPPQRRLSLI